MPENLSIPESERENIRKLLDALKKAGKEMDVEIETKVVGGVLNKTWPRKDIDITFRTVGMKGKGLTELDRAIDEFKTLSKIARRATEIDNDFAIDEEKEPAMDEEFGSPNILKFDGRIRVKSKRGALVELIRKKHE